MLEMDVNVKFSCRDKALQNKLRDIFDLTCDRRQDFLGLGELDGNARWEQFYSRIESIAKPDQEYSLVDSYITTLKNMTSKKGFVKLHYVAGVYGKEFADEMKSFLRNLGVDEVKAAISEPTKEQIEEQIDEPAVIASGC